MPRKTKKKVSVSKLKKKLWEICSKYIRLRDQNRCFTCGRWAEGAGYHCGHFIASSVCGVALRFDERNLAGQCFHCNINLGGNGAEYYRRMVAKHGQDFVDALWKEKEALVQWKEADYLAKIAYYQKKYEELSQKYG